MMREVVFDTETTGLDPLKGDRLVEIGCIELLEPAQRETAREYRRQPVGSQRREHDHDSGQCKEPKDDCRRQAAQRAKIEKGRSMHAPGSGSPAGRSAGRR